MISFVKKNMLFHYLLDNYFFTNCDNFLKLLSYKINVLDVFNVGRIFLKFSLYPQVLKFRSN